MVGRQGNGGTVNAAAAIWLIKWCGCHFPENLLHTLLWEVAKTRETRLWKTGGTLFPVKPKVKTIISTGRTQGLLSFTTILVTFLHSVDCPNRNSIQTESNRDRINLQSHTDR